MWTNTRWSHSSRGKGCKACKEERYCKLYWSCTQVVSLTKNEFILKDIPLNSNNSNSFLQTSFLLLVFRSRGHTSLWKQHGINVHLHWTGLLGRNWFLLRILVLGKFTEERYNFSLLAGGGLLWTGLEELQGLTRFFYSDRIFRL